MRRGIMRRVVGPRRKASPAKALCAIGAVLWLLGATGIALAQTYNLTEVFQTPGTGCELAGPAATPGPVRVSGCASADAAAALYCTRPTPHPEALDKLLALDRSTGALQYTINISDYFGGCDWDGSFLWIVRNTARTIAKVNISPPGTIVTQFPLPDTGAFGGLAYSAGYLWVQSPVNDPGGHSHIDKIDVGTGNVVSGLTVTGGAITGGLAMVSGKLYGVVNDDNVTPNQPPGPNPEAIIRVNPTTGVVEATYVLPNGLYPIDVAPAGPSSIFNSMLKNRDLHTPMYVYRMDFTSGLPALSWWATVFLACLLLFWAGVTWHGAARHR